MCASLPSFLLIIRTTPPMPPPIKYSTVQYSTVQYSTVQYSTVQYSTVQYSTVQYSTVLHNTDYICHFANVSSNSSWSHYERFNL